MGWNSTAVKFSMLNARYVSLNTTIIVITDVVLQCEKKPGIDEAIFILVKRHGTYFTEMFLILLYVELCIPLSTN